jgi:hypothetical protein
MKRMKHKVLGCLALLLLCAVSDNAVAQILSHGDLFGPGAPPPMAGIQVGIGQHAQQGTFQGNCDCTFENGTGAGFLGMGLFELPLDYEWAVGIMIGPDFKKFSTTTVVSEVGVVNYIKNNQNVVDSTSFLKLDRTSNVKTTYLAFLPYVQYQFFRMGPFLQGGLNVGYLMSSNYTQTRDLIDDKLTLPGPNGATVENLRFSNGTKSETLQNEDPIAGVNKIRLAVVISAGYNLAVSERSVFSPLLSYDFPLTTIRNEKAANWKIGSLYASAVLKFKLD